MQLSNQAIGAIMMALQESLMNQSDIVPVFQGFKLQETDDGLIVTNPPSVRLERASGAEEQMDSSPE
jgi:hypothetical protein|tara:strand:+ start:810 stop:1010 length:201 start_codon:yes stop_codon:yes gene_type:complete